MRKTTIQFGTEDIQRSITAVGEEHGLRTPKRVLHVFDHSSPLLSGYSVRSQSLMRAQKNIGFLPEALTGPLHQLEDSGAKDITVDGLHYRRTLLTPGFRQSLINKRFPLLRELTVVQLIRKRILELVDTESFDVLHAHSPALCGLAALQAAKRSIPVVYEIRAFWEDAAVDQKKTSVRSARYHMTRRLELHVAHRAHAVVGIARHILEDLHERGVASEKLFHVPNGVDAARFVSSSRDVELASHLGLDGEPVLGFIGSLYRYEGVAWLVRASAQLRRQGVPFKLLVVGQGEELPEIREAVREVGAESYVKLLGQVPHDQVKRYYSLMDVMVYPRCSVRLTELTTPLKLLEAMAQSKAVLASGVGGIRELVGPDPPCLLFAPGDADDFCRKALQLIADRQFREDLGHRARQMVLREKDWNFQARRYESVYAFAASEQQGGK